MPTRSTPPQTPPVELKLRARFLRFIAAEHTAGRRVVLSDWQVNNLARIAYQALPQPRDTEVTQRGPVAADSELSVNAIERLVLEQLPTELDTDGIAAVLGVTKGQVQRAQKSLYRLLGCQARHSAVAVAIRRGLLADRDGGVWRCVWPPEALGGSGAGDAAPEGVPVALAGVQGVGGER